MTRDYSLLILAEVVGNVIVHAVVGNAGRIRTQVVIFNLTAFAVRSQRHAGAKTVNGIVEDMSGAIERR